MRILIAEDDPISLVLLQALLNQWGYEVIVTHDGNEAWQVLQADMAPRLAILDWEMPGTDGPALCHQVRERQGSPYTYIILLTARTKREDLIAGMEAGADDYVTKPFDAHELRVRLRAGRRILDLQNALLEAQEVLRLQATQDPLTSLWNRGMIMELLGRELARAKRERSPLSVLMLDLDLFKIVNDTYGHMAGDLVLREAAQRMRGSVRAYDAVGRYGGEEFLIVSPGCPAAGAVNLAERIRKAIGEKPMNTSEALISITISVGVATAEYVDKRATPNKNLGEYTEAENLVRAADDALYRAKRWGRNRVESNTVNLARKP